MARFMRQWTEDFVDWRFEVDDLLEARNAVVGRLRQSGRGKASGAPVENQFGTVFRLQGGQIVRIEIYTNVTEALKAAGLEE